MSKTKRNGRSEISESLDFQSSRSWNLSLDVLGRTWRRIEQVRDIVTFSGARRKQATSNNAARSSFPPRPKYSITNECSAIKQPLSLFLLRLQHATDVAPRVKDLVTRVFLTRLRLPPPPLPPPNGFNPSLALPLSRRLHLRRLPPLSLFASSS